MLSDLDTRKTSLNDLGRFIPSVSRLVLTKSFIPDIRQLGAKYSNLTALFLNDCHLVDLEGIGSISSTLATVSFQNNFVVDLEPLSGIWNLTTCDLRNNRIQDTEQLEYLKFCQKLEKIWISDNPFVIDMSSDAITKIEEDLIPAPYISSTESSKESLDSSTPVLDVILPSPPKSQEGRINPRKPRSSRAERFKKPLAISESTEIIASSVAEITPRIPESLPQLKKSIRVAYRLPIN
jgi:hypothetical protein